jgi:hypothetical protein
MAEAEELRATEEENYRTNLLRNHLFVELIGTITDIENTNQCRKDIARFVHFRKCELSQITNRTRRNIKLKELKNNHITLVLLLLNLDKYKVIPPILLLIPFFETLANHSSLDEMNDSYKQQYKYKVF